MKEHYDGDNAVDVFKATNIPVRKILNARTIKTQFGIELLNFKTEVRGGQTFMFKYILDNSMFDSLCSLKIETKFEYSNHPSFFHYIKVISLNNIPFMLLNHKESIDDEDKNFVECYSKIINYEQNILFIDLYHKCLIKDIRKENKTDEMFCVM